MEKGNIRRRIALPCLSILLMALTILPTFALEAADTPITAIPMPETGLEVIATTEAMIDITPASSGFVLCKYTTSAANAAVDIAKFGSNSSRSFLAKKNEYEAIPLSEGSGLYVIKVIIDRGDGRYINACETTIDVTIDEDSTPFLLPNAMVNYSEETALQGWKIIDSAKSGFEALAAVYSYIVENIAYDYEKLEADRSNYKPDAGDTLITGEGICIDYAVLAAALLRMQGIPTKVQFGTPAGDNADYPTHAWISVYMEEGGYLGDLYILAGEWTQLDPTFAANDPYFSGSCEGYTVMAVY